MTPTASDADVREMARGLSEAQRRAVRSFPEPYAVRLGDETVYPRPWRKAVELGVSGNTLVSLRCLGGVDRKTLRAGPALTMEDWSSEGRHWALTDLGEALRRHLMEKDNG